MKLFAEILFWLCVLAIVHSYIIYPWLLKFFVRGKKLHAPTPSSPLPRVTLMMSVFNEASVIRKKLDSIDQLAYPKDLLHIYIGSDASDDGTNEIIAAWAKDRENVHFYPFESRSGKVRVINRLDAYVRKEVPASPRHIYLFTDANVILDKDVLRYLIRHFENPAIALVDTQMINLGSCEEDISDLEAQYISREVMIKHREGLWGGFLMGPFGGCFALRSDFYTPVPDTYRVDDFFIAMQALQSGGKLISDLEAKAYEAIPHDIKEEYRRKRRISSGNFQNLAYFSSMLWRPPLARAFAFFSHKVLRWLGPLIMAIGFIALSYLAWEGSTFYKGIWMVGVFVVAGIPVLDMILSRMGIRIPYFLHIKYFVMMNIALLEGFIEYLKGIKTNVWQPPKRTGDDGYPT